MLRGRTRASRIVTSLLLAGLLLPGLALASVGYESTDSARERCVGCSGCEQGKCDDDASGHDHCCQSSCSAHAVWLLSAPIRIAAPSAGADRPLAVVPLAPQGRPGSLFHPPRS
jgi:hypothetical protein